MTQLQERKISKEFPKTKLLKNLTIYMPDIFMEKVQNICQKCASVIQLMEIILKLP